MAKNGRPNPKQDASLNSFVREEQTPSYHTGKFSFVDGYLDAIDRDWLSTNSEYRADYVFDLVAAIGDEYKLSVSHDYKSGKFLATIACRGLNLPNTGSILTSRGSTAVNALYALAYKFLVKYKDTAWGDGSASNQWD